jgi:hypothetical protein
MPLTPANVRAGINPLSFVIQSEGVERQTTHSASLKTAGMCGICEMTRK